MIHKLVVGLDYLSGSHSLAKARYQLCHGVMAEKPRGACSYWWKKVTCLKCLKLGKQKGCPRTGQQKQLGGTRGKA